MSAILLPAIRRESVNLFSYKMAGVVSSGTGPPSWGTDPDRRVTLSEVGLAVGDVFSYSAEIRNLTAGDQVDLAVTFRRADGTQITDHSANVNIDTQTFQRVEVDGVTIPAETSFIYMYCQHPVGTGTVEIRRGMINRGPTAQPYDIPKRGAWAPITHGQLVRDNEQFVHRYLSGASQITTFPSRRWLLQFATHILEGDELREWSLALDRLSDLTNVFHFVPPEYTGPSTGYEGPLPVVNGAGQLGTSLDCDGVTPETDIVGPGDYVSFPVTTSAGQTNYELHRISSLCTSDESGEVTLEFTRPIRLAPANDAAVQIYSPIGQFRLAVPRAGQDIQLLRRASVSVEAEEAIWL